MTRAEEAALEQYPIENGKMWTSAFGTFEFDRNYGERQAFQKGYEQAEKGLGWVSVKEKLPGPSEWVVACVEVDGICTCLTLATYNDDTKEWHTDDWEDGEQEEYHHDYWLPIPTKVKEDEK